MESILTYILQINLLLTVVYVGYFILLKRLTFYRLNRIYFMIGSIYAIAYPFLDITKWFGETVRVHIPEALDYLPMMPTLQSEKYTLERLLISAIGLFAFSFLVRLIVQLISLLRIHLYSSASQWKGYFFRNVVFSIAPFSFFNKIYIHRAQHADPELNDIFKHEHIHVKGLHTIDILWFEIVLIGGWYNPFVWLMRRAVRQNLEYLTDQQVLDKGVDRQAYQYSLLNVTKQGAAVGIGNQFNFKSLKKRIMMMNKKRSSKIELSKYAFLLPILILAGATFTVKQAEAKIETLTNIARETPIDVFLPRGIKENQLAIPQDSVKNIVVTSNGSTVKVVYDSVSTNRSLSTFKWEPTSKEGVDLNNVLIVLDDKVISSDDFKTIKPDEIKAISVLKDKAALSLYGGDGKNGVILVTTKENRATFQGIKGDGQKLTVEEVDSLYGDYDVVVSESKDPLIVLKGPVATSSNIDPNKIEHITVIKNGLATQVYGEKGRNGVIEISMKDGETTLKQTSTHANNLDVVTVKGRQLGAINGKELSADRRSIRLGEPSSLKNPAYIVNGVLKSSKEYATIDTKKIKKIYSLPKEQIVGLYGDKFDLKDHDGAVVIETK